MARRRTSGRGPTAKRLPGWGLLLLGLALGVAAVLLAQLLMQRAGSSDGIAGLFAAKTKPVEQPAAQRPEPAPVKPKLDFYTVLPEVETVLPDRTTKSRQTKAERDDNARYILQAGSFATFEDADQLKARLALQGLQARIQKVTIEGKGDYHRVRLGPYRNVEELDAVSQQLSKLGIKTLRLRVKSGAG